MSEAAERCAVHPARPALDDCPVCDRPRCAADAGAAPGGGCLACEGSTAPPTRPPVGLRALAGAGVAAHLTTLLASLIASEYVDSGVVGYLTPVVLGIIVGVADEFCARLARGWPIRILAVSYALVGAGYSLTFVPGRPSPFTPFGKVWWSYAGAALGAWLWTVPPPRRPVPTPSAASEA